MMSFKCLCVVLLLMVGLDSSSLPAPLAVQIKSPQASVFKVYVWLSERPTVPLEGTAFVIHSTGSPDNPTLYFLTAAHVVLGDTADDNTKLDVVDRIEVRFGGGKGDVWEIDKKTVRIPQQWESNGRDFAIFKKVGAGRGCIPLPISESAPENNAFKAFGYPQSFQTVLPISGTILGSPGEATAQEWYVVDSSLSPGMSGGPVLSSEGVFAIIEGRHQAAQELKLIVPIGLARSFIQENILLPYSSNDLSTERTYWDTIKNSTDPDDFKAYITKYPKGHFIALAHTRFSETSNLLLQQASTLYNQHKWSDAEALYRKAIRLGVAPNTAQWHTDFGVTLYKQNRISDAEEQFTRAVQLEPDQPIWIYNLGLTKLLQKKWPEYEATQRRLTVLEPNNSGKYAELALALFNQGKFAEAEVAIRKALELDPPNQTYQDRLALILAVLKKGPA